MPYPSSVLKITDRFGTDYTDLFDDISFDVDSYMHSIAVGQTPHSLFFGGGTHGGIDTSTPHPSETTIVNSPHSPRANADGPLGALIVRWIQARVESPSDVFGWQYIDAFDIHTIAFTHKQQVDFINIHGRVEGGQRVYDLQELGYALELRFDIVKVEA